MAKLTPIGLGQYPFELSRDLRELFDEVNRLKEKIGLLTNDDISRLSQVGSASVPNHSTTHKPGSTDPLATAAPPTVDLTPNAEGTSTSFSRADHKHDLDESIEPTWTGDHEFDGAVQVDGLLTANAATTINNALDLNGTLDIQGAVTLENAVFDASTLPSGAAQPGAVNVGELWVDTADESVKRGV